MEDDWPLTKLNWLDWPLLAKERPGTFGTAGTSAGSPPSNRKENVALSLALIVFLSKDAVKDAGPAAEANCVDASRVRSASNHAALHEPQSAAGILPAEESEESSADETSAAPCWRHRPLVRGSWSQCTPQVRRLCHYASTNGMASNRVAIALRRGQSETV